MSSRRLQLYSRANIFYLELNDPPANRTDQLFFQELADIIPILYDKREAHGLIIYTRGRHFSSGADIDELRSHASREGGKIASRFISRSIDSFGKLAERP